MKSSFSTHAVVLLVFVTFAACSSATRRAEDTSGNQGSTAAISSPAPVASATVAPAPEVTPLKTPERVASGEVTESGGTWNKAVQSITYVSSADNSRQPMMFYKPQSDEAHPLLVALHSWSANYRQKESVIYAEWAIANNWIFIHPNFRGPNTKPETTGSEMVIGDVLSAIEYAKANAHVDASRIYAVGWSQSGTPGESDGGLKVLFRRQSGNARITVFDGAHDKNTEAAFRWLNNQKRQP